MSEEATTNGAAAEAEGGAGARAGTGGHGAYRKASLDGYSSNIFPGKGAQMGVVANFIKTRGFLPPELIETEVAWFYK